MGWSIVIVATSIITLSISQTYTLPPHACSNPVDFPQAIEHHLNNIGTLSICSNGAHISSLTSGITNRF